MHFKPPIGRPCVIAALSSLCCPTLLPTIAAEEETAAPCRICNVMQDANYMAGMVAEFIVKKDLKNWSCCSRTSAAKSAVALEEGKRRYFMNRFTVEAMKKAYGDYTDFGSRPEVVALGCHRRKFRNLCRRIIEAAALEKARWVKELRFMFRPGGDVMKKVGGT